MGLRSQTRALRVMGCAGLRERQGAWKPKAWRWRTASSTCCTKALQSFYRSCRSSRISTYRILRHGPTGLCPAGAARGHRVPQGIKRARGVVEKNPGASLVDLGHGVLCLEFHSKMNAIGDDALQCPIGRWTFSPSASMHMVIANEGENFSAARTCSLLAARRSAFRLHRKSIQHFQTACCD